MGREAVEAQERPKGSRLCPVCFDLFEVSQCPKDGVSTIGVQAAWVGGQRVAEGAIIDRRYRLEKPIGQGGYGTIYQATHTGTGNPLALKVFGAHRQDPGALERFCLEARMTTALQHTNTVRAFDFGQDESGALFIAMELLNGRTLLEDVRERIAEELPYREDEIIDIGLGVIRALGEAHDAGIIHRDLKPSNIFLHTSPAHSRVIKVLDFGIAKVQGGPALTAMTGAMPGTAIYISPERVAGADACPQSDFYSLGVILFLLVTGDPPFKGKNSLATMSMHVNNPVPDLNVDSPVPVSPALARLIHRSLQKRPEDRFRDSREMEEALVAARAEQWDDQFESKTELAPQAWNPESIRSFTVSVPLPGPVGDPEVFNPAEPSLPTETHASDAAATKPPPRPVPKQPKETFDSVRETAPGPARRRSISWRQLVLFVLLLIVSALCVWAFLQGRPISLAPTAPVNPPS